PAHAVTGRPDALRRQRHRSGRTRHLDRRLRCERVVPQAPRPEAPAGRSPFPAAGCRHFKELTGRTHTARPRLSRLAARTRFPNGAVPVSVKLATVVPAVGGDSYRALAHSGQT